MIFQASRPQKKTRWWVPSQLPPGKRRPPSGLQEDAGSQASRSSRARALQPALPPWQTSPTAGPSLPAGPEVSPGLSLSPGAAGGSECRGRSELEQQENIKDASAGSENWSVYFGQGQSHMLLMDKCGLTNHKLTVGKGINLYLLYQQICFALPPPWLWLWMIRALKEGVGFLLSSPRWTQTKTKIRIFI